MVKSFNDYIKESLTGAISMDGNTVSNLNQPDYKGRTNSINTGRGGPGRGNAVPYQWGSTALSFGANPKEKNKKRKMGKKVMSFSSFSNKAIKEQEEANVVLNIPEKYKAEQTAITSLKDEIANIEQQLAAKKVDLNNKVKDLQTKMTTDQNQAAQSGTVQGTVAPSQTTPTS